MADTSNRFGVGQRGDHFVILKPLPPFLEKRDAINLAVWLVALADHEQDTFDELLAQVLST